MSEDTSRGRLSIAEVVPSATVPRIWRLLPRIAGRSGSRAADGPAPAAVRGPHTQPTDRGLADVVAVALLVAIVVVGALAVATSGGRVLEDSRTRSDSMAAVSTLEEADARLTSLARDGASGRVELAVDPGRADAYRIERSGSIEVSIDGGTCRTTVPITAISYRTLDGGRLVYAAGGVWATSGDGSRVITPPDLTYRNRTIKLSAMNLSGRLTGSVSKAELLPSSVPATRAAERDLFAERACLRPDSVTIAVTSERYLAWSRYLADEFGLDVGSGVTVDDSTGTATVRLDESMLPVEADDDRNQVVDFQGGYGQHDAGNISVVKGSDSLTYPVSIALLSGDTQGGQPTVTVHRSRTPLDVALVIDESGSMDETGTTGATKLEETQNASKRFAGLLNASAGDRVGVVGYSDTGFCWWGNPCPPNYPDDARVHYGLSDGDGLDTDAINSTIDTALRADGGTPIAAGLDETTDLFVDDARVESKRVAVLLSDGQHNGDGNVTEAAIRAADHNVTIHAVGFGEDADADLLREVANRTGGEYYHAEGGVELSEQFEQIALEISKSRAIETPPLTLQAGATTLLPNGSTRAVPPNGSAYNLNAPSVRRPLAYSTELRDGQAVPLAITTWNCDRWTRTNETFTGPDGYEYAKTWCSAAPSPDTTIEPATGSARVRSFTEGDTVADLPTAPGTWVESDLTTVLRSAGMVDDGGALSLSSNQVVLAYDLADGPAGAGDFNDLVLLVEVGYATDEVSVAYAVDVSIAEVRMGPSS